MRLKNHNCLPEKSKATPTHTYIPDESGIKALSGKALRILIVEDNADSAFVLATLLESLGHETHHCQASAQAIELAQKILPDVLLLDLGLPEMNGYSLCQALKDIEGLERSLFIAQTGWGEREHHEASLQAGFDYHLVKPIHSEDLEKILGHFIASRN